MADANESRGFLLSEVDAGQLPCRHDLAMTAGGADTCSDLLVVGHMIPQATAFAHAIPMD